MTDNVMLIPRNEYLMRGSSPNAIPRTTSTMAREKIGLIDVCFFPMNKAPKTTTKAATAFVNHYLLFVRGE
jgi:hypothetical protein